MEQGVVAAGVSPQAVLFQAGGRAGRQKMTPGQGQWTALGRGLSPCRGLWSAQGPALTLGAQQ